MSRQSMFIIGIHTPDHRISDKYHRIVLTCVVAPLLIAPVVVAQIVAEAEIVAEVPFFPRPVNGRHNPEYDNQGKRQNHRQFFG